MSYGGGNGREIPVSLNRLPSLLSVANMHRFWFLFLIPARVKKGDRGEEFERGCAFYGGGIGRDIPVSPVSYSYQLPVTDMHTEHDL